MQGVSVAASVFTLVAIAADRYVAVVRVPKSTIDGRQAAGIILFIWILSATLSIPQAVVLETRTVEYTGVPVLACQEQWPSLTYRRVYTVALFLALFFTPLVIICYMYVKISRKLWPDNGSEGGTPRCSARSAAANDRDSRMIWIVKMLLVVVILFAVSWLPLHVVTIVGDFGDLSTWHGTVLYDYIYPVAHWLAYLNSCMNPIVYGYFNKNFRRMMNDDTKKQGPHRNNDGKLQGTPQTHIEMTDRSVFNCTTPATLRSVVAIQSTIIKP
ncbi:neuropeptide FF receptor 2-like isoform X2 [Branchiostoma lanceolatum]|uniref:neuropeptide FF receptor 2-like isoform X2 n=1 Tax=Branchiostoma lanceolatum TaxID=7740 RepID=UPI0034540AFE